MSDSGDDMRTLVFDESRDKMRKAVAHLDGADRAAAQANLGTDREVAVFRQLEQLDGGVGLRAGRPADVEHVVELLQLDGALDGQVGPGPPGQLGR